MEGVGGLGVDGGATPARVERAARACVMGHRNSSTPLSMAERNFLLVAALSVELELAALFGGIVVCEWHSSFRAG